METPDQAMTHGRGRTGTWGGGVSRDSPLFSGHPPCMLGTQGTEAGCFLLWLSLGCWAALTHALGVLGTLRAFLTSCCPWKLLCGPYTAEQTPCPHARAQCNMPVDQLSPKESRHHGPPQQGCPNQLRINEALTLIKVRSGDLKRNRTQRS